MGSNLPPSDDDGDLERLREPVRPRLVAPVEVVDMGDGLGRRAARVVEEADGGMWGDRDRELGGGRGEESRRPLPRLSGSGGGEMVSCYEYDMTWIKDTYYDLV